MDPATASRHSTLAAEVGVEAIKMVAKNIENHKGFNSKNKKLILYYVNKTKTHQIKISELQQISGRCDMNLECRWFGHGYMGATLHCEGDNLAGEGLGTSGTFKITAKEISTGNQKSAYINFSNPFLGCCKIGYSYKSAAQADRQGDTQSGNSRLVMLGSYSLPCNVILTPKHYESTPTFTLVARP